MFIVLYFLIYSVYFYFSIISNPCTLTLSSRNVCNFTRFFYINRLFYTVVVLFESFFSLVIVSERIIVGGIHIVPFFRFSKNVLENICIFFSSLFENCTASETQLHNKKNKESFIFIKTFL